MELEKKDHDRDIVPLCFQELCQVKLMDLAHPPGRLLGLEF
jgi:hypothetical protein